VILISLQEDALIQWVVHMNHYNMPVILALIKAAAAKIGKPHLA
jgi:hypothetical protein